jgi:hypothetical protein
MLPLEELLEIAQLSDTQLDATDMAEGAYECFGLTEWNLARDGFLRPDLRYLAQLTPTQREEAQRKAGLAFTRMSLAQQQPFIASILGSSDDPPPSLEELRWASLRIEYTWFRWEPLETKADGLGNRHIGLSPVRERTRSATLQAAQRIDPQVAEAHIMPTELAVTLVYTIGSPRTGFTARVRCATPTHASGWSHRSPADRSGAPGPG